MASAAAQLSALLLAAEQYFNFTVRSISSLPFGWALHPPELAT
jgi:hypothetical protein